MERVLSNIDPALRRCWHPVARPGEVTAQPHRVMLLGEPWVLYRAAGRIVIEDIGTDRSEDANPIRFGFVRKGSLH